MEKLLEKLRIAPIFFTPHNFLMPGPPARLILLSIKNPASVEEAGLALGK
jgi:hypothetical protein